MKHIVTCILLVLLLMKVAVAEQVCRHCPNFTSWACQKIHQIWTEGDTELYFTGYAWHNRFAYSQERVTRYNESAWGGGLGKGYYDEDDDWHGLYAFAFLDSHKNVEPIAGYAFLKTLLQTAQTKFGAGFTAFITARPDIFNNVPFPGALPWLGLTHRRATLLATYIPGAQGAGNVLFILGKWRF